MSQPSFGELDGQDPYEILELPPGAPDADIRAARKRLLRRYHPDMPSGDLRRTQLITAAADLLLDPLRRDGYYDLRGEQSRRTVFATADATDDRYGSDGPEEPIRPTFVTPPPGPSARNDPFRAASAFAAEGFFTASDSFAPSSAPAWDAPGADDAPGPADPRPGSTSGGAEPQPDRAGRRSRDSFAVSRWNALAIASVVAILTWTPIPLVLGLLALRQIRRYDQRGMRLAVTGIVAGAVLALIYLYFLVSTGF
ncbi:DUF4190 domain-containing protein [Planosporangium thailandense]|uniref:DUF4190 domain-containing protein n=1 Tax=Planosporangium thailandense TaxID=765197 RepID=A0ABX0XSC5_9ACTN|nr:DUF4190 domain-containing protein [Planosporangium thailandense]